MPHVPVAGGDAQVVALLVVDHHPRLHGVETIEAAQIGRQLHRLPVHPAEVVPILQAVLADLKGNRDVDAALKGGEEDVTQEQFDAMMDDYLRRLAQQEPEDWSAQAREWAEENGIIRGDEHGNKQYRSFCTREQMVVFLKRVKEM